MALFKTSAIVLKSRRWGEADRIVILYTPQFGKLRGIARGARRVKSRLGGALEPFVHCELNLFEKAPDTLARISHADIRETFPALREDLHRMSGAARIANLVDAVSGERDACPRLFEAILAGLRAMQETDDPFLTALVFQIKLLGLTGYRPQTEHCVACGTQGRRRQDRQLVAFSPASGGLVCRTCAGRRTAACLPLSPGGQALLQQIIRWGPEVVTRLKATGQVRAELETAVEAYVTVVAGRQLPGVDFLAAEGPPPLYASDRPASPAPVLSQGKRAIPTGRVEARLS